MSLAVQPALVPTARAIEPERRALLEAIAAQPEDDTARLVYADWLTDHGTCDRDAATAEFIRVSCDAFTANRPLTQRKPKQTVAEGRWLNENWRRLVPAVSEHVIKRPRRSGRRINCVIDLPAEIYAPGECAFPNESEPWNWPVYCCLEFWRGFVRWSEFDCVGELLLAVPVLAEDQPFVRPSFPQPLWWQAEEQQFHRFSESSFGAAWPHLIRVLSDHCHATNTPLMRTNEGGHAVRLAIPFTLDGAAERLTDAAFSAWARECARKAGAL